jgi:hypothetical protein
VRKKLNSQLIRPEKEQELLELARKDLLKKFLILK